MKTRFTPIIVILLLELLAILYVRVIAENEDIYYSLTARYSARISFILLCIIGLWISRQGVKSLYLNDSHKNYLLGGLVAFTVNHLIHFYFLYKNFEVNELDIGSKVISFGALAYVILSIVPIYLWLKNSWYKSIGLIVTSFVALMIGICIYTYSTRFSSELPLPPAILYFQIAIGAGVLTIILMARRFLKERNSNSN